MGRLGCIGAHRVHWAPRVHWGAKGAEVGLPRFAQMAQGGGQLQQCISSLLRVHRIKGD